MVIFDCRIVTERGGSAAKEFKKPSL